MSRLRLVMGASALLYLGPLLAGLGGAGWSWAPAFAAVFVLWLIVMRPQDWPRQAAAWANPAVPLRAVTHIAVQLLLVLVMFALGRGIGGVAGVAPLWPAWAPLLLSALSVPLARLAWNPARGAELDRFLDEAIAGLQAAVPPAASPDQRRQIGALVRRLRDLPPGTGAEAVWPMVRAAAEELPRHDLADAVWTEARTGDDVMRLAFLLLATDGETAESVGGDLPTRALMLIEERPDLFPLYAQRMQAALEAYPGLWYAAPTDEVLGDLIGRHPGPGAAALAALQARLRDLAPDED